MDDVVEIIFLIIAIIGVSALASWLHITFWYKPNVLDPLEEYLEEKVRDND